MNVMFVIGARAPLEFILKNGVMAFRANVNTSPIVKGQKFAVYTTRGAYGNPTKDSAQIIALGVITTEVLDRPVVIEEETFDRSCGLRISHSLPLRQGLNFAPLVDVLGFVGGARRYPSVVHRTLVKVPHEDFILIEQAFDDHLQELRTR